MLFKNLFMHNLNKKTKTLHIQKIKLTSGLLDKSSTQFLNK